MTLTHLAGVDQFNSGKARVCFKLSKPRLTNRPLGFW